MGLRSLPPHNRLQTTAQRFGAFVSAGAYENSTQQIEQPVCADRDQRGANRNECLSGHWLPPQEGDKRRARLPTVLAACGQGTLNVAPTASQRRPPRQMAMCKMAHHP